MGRQRARAVHDFVNNVPLTVPRETAARQIPGTDVVFVDKARESRPRGATLLHCEFQTLRVRSLWTRPRIITPLIPRRFTVGAASIPFPPHPQVAHTR